MVEVACCVHADAVLPLIVLLNGIVVCYTGKALGLGVLFLLHLPLHVFWGRKKKQNATSAFYPLFPLSTTSPASAAVTSGVWLLAVVYRTLCCWFRHCRSLSRSHTCRSFFDFLLLLSPFLSALSLCEFERDALLLILSGDIVERFTVRFCFLPNLPRPEPPDYVGGKDPGLEETTSQIRRQLLRSMALLRWEIRNRVSETYHIIYNTPPRTSNSVCATGV